MAKYGTVSPGSYGLKEGIHYLYYASVPAYHESWCRAFPERSLRRRYSGIAATGRHGDGRWHAGCLTPTSLDTRSLHRDKSAWRSRPHAGGGCWEAPARDAEQEGLWDRLSLA